MRTVKSIKKRLVAQADICHTLSTKTNTSLQLVMCFISGQATISSKNVLLAQTERADTNLHQLLLLFKLACRVYGGERWQTQHRNKEEKRKKKERTPTTTKKRQYHTTQCATIQPHRSCERQRLHVFYVVVVGSEQKAIHLKILE